MALTRIDELGRTAFITAQWRLEESRRPAPLFDDRVAAVFLDEQAEAMAGRLAQVMPEAKSMIIYRTRYFDDYLRKILGAVEQLVVLGAGFDTRSIRFGTDGARWFELDRQPVLDFKLECLRRSGQAPPATYLPCDYVREDFVARLEEAGFDPARPSYFMWEGNSFFLPEAEVTRALERIRQRVQRFHVTLDYMSDRIISRTTGFDAITRFADSYEAAGAAFITGFPGIASLAERIPVPVVEDFPVSELRRTYGRDQEGDPALFRFYFVATLGAL